ncbi:unnamed protein product [Orchesella dallaii]|uniref:CCHC-type domain-containing protein n=1 Tax=Orchesella dallaii TaxID=48710 RepID=A0ABP1QD11_9HEXA
MSKLFAVLLFVAMVFAIASANPAPQLTGYGVGLGSYGYNYPTLGGGLIYATSAAGATSSSSSAVPGPSSSTAQSSTATHTSTSYTAPRITFEVYEENKAHNNHNTSSNQLSASSKPHSNVQQTQRSRSDDALCHMNANTGRDRRDNRPKGKNNRTPDGRVICDLCYVFGHVKKYCPQQRSNTPSQPNQTPRFFNNRGRNNFSSQQQRGRSTNNSREYVDEVVNQLLQFFTPPAQNANASNAPAIPQPALANNSQPNQAFRNNSYFQQPNRANNLHSLLQNFFESGNGQFENFAELQNQDPKIRPIVESLNVESEALSPSFRAASISSRNSSPLHFAASEDVILDTSCPSRKPSPSIPIPTVPIPQNVASSSSSVSELPTPFAIPGPSTVSIPSQLFREQEDLEEEFHSAPSSQGEDPPPSPPRVITPPITLSPTVPVPEPIVFQRPKTPEPVISPNPIVSESDTESDSSTSSLRRSARSRNPAKRFGFDEYVEQGSSRAGRARKAEQSRIFLLKMDEKSIAVVFNVVPSDKPDSNVDKSFPEQAMEVVQSILDPKMLSVANGDIPFGISPLKRPEGYVPKLKVNTAKRRSKSDQPFYARVNCYLCKSFGHRERHCPVRPVPPPPSATPVPLMSLDFDENAQLSSKSTSGV